MERSAIRGRANDLRESRILRSLSSGGALRRPVGSIRATLAFHFGEPCGLGAGIGGATIPCRFAVFA